MNHPTIRRQAIISFASAFALATAVSAAQAHHGADGSSAAHAHHAPLVAQASGHDAHQPGAHDSHGAAGKDAAASEAVTNGEILKVDRDGSRVTIRHGELPEFGMAAMTMLLGVREPALLEGVSAGDHVRVRIARDGPRFVIIGIERAR